MALGNVSAPMSLWNTAHPWLHDLVSYEPGKPIEELERELGITNIIKLASNENPFGPSPHALAAYCRPLAGFSAHARQG